MATPFYARMAATAVRLLTKYGSPLTMSRIIEGEYDSSTSTTSTTTQTFTITGAKFDYRNDEIDGTRILSGDARVYVSPGSERPRPSDSILIAGEAWNVVQAESLIPATTAVLYDVQVRK